ncbi:hypothetical protein [Streptomyces sp. NPDC059928]|uniref:hypothetical protein n=1 Tax=unclassified Streptomyces TaxID=2593676 RepID=UPI00364F0B56
MRTTRVRPYVKADGTEVRGHIRRLPDLAGPTGGGLLLAVAVVLIVGFGGHAKPDAVPGSGAFPGAGSSYKPESATVYPIKWPAGDKQQDAQKPRPGATYPIPWAKGRAW